MSMLFFKFFLTAIVLDNKSLSLSSFQVQLIQVKHNQTNMGT